MQEVEAEQTVALGQALQVAAHRVVRQVGQLARVPGLAVAQGLGRHHALRLAPSLLVAVGFGFA